MGSLREECKERLKVAFDSVRAVSNTLTFILVVDNYGLKVLSNTIKMMELINYGITIVERLELKRKRIPKLEAVYLINPLSYELMLDDYPQDGQSQYQSVHILSLSKIPAQILQRMTQNSTFARKVKTLKEINFNFSLHSHNEVKLCSYDEKSFDKSVMGNSSLLEATVDELSTIVTTMSTFYIVEIYYQKSPRSNFTEKVALGLKERFENVFKTYEKYGIQNYNSSAPITTFLILDRCYDAVSPLVRDFHYLPLFYDLRNVTNHRITDWGKEKKAFALNENDEVLDKYKNAHISSALKGIPADFEEFTQNHAAAKFHKQPGEDMDVGKLGEVLKKMPQYIDVKDRYSMHYEALEEILESMEGKQLKNQGFLEQSMLSLTNEQGKKIKQKDVYANLVSQLQKIKNNEEKAKLILIGLLCLQLKPKEQNTLTDFLVKTPYAGIDKLMTQVSGPITYRLNPKKQSKGNEILDRHQTKLEQIVREISNQNHGDLKHLRVGAAQKSAKPAAKNQTNLGRKKINLENDKKDRPRMIVFVNSALGYNQMRALSEYENSYQMIYTSHNFVTQTQYLKLVAGLGGLGGEEEEEL